VAEVAELTGASEVSPASGERLRVLFTEGASLSARQTLYGVGPFHDIDVLDPDPLCQCRFSSYVRRFVRSPSYSKEPARFLQFLAKALAEEKYDVLLPTHEQVYLLSRVRDSLTARVGVALPEFAAVERLQNKAEFSRLLTEMDLPQPATMVVRTPDELANVPRFPFYLKLAHGTAGAGVWRIESHTELDERVEILRRNGFFAGQSEILVQQPGCGVQSTVQAVFNRGKIVGIHSFEARRLGVGGMSTARTSADHPLVREQMARLGRHLDWHGALFIDYFYDRESGRPEYIEANPRIGETVNALRSGVNLPQLLVEVSRGRSPPPAPPGKVGVRTHSFMMILMSMAFEGHGRKDLIREIREHAAGRGVYENSEDELTRPHDDRLSRLPRLWIATQLLAWPGLARKIVAKTVENYSLPESAIAEIKAMPRDAFRRLAGPADRSSAVVPSVD
jgi:predicted ATP-grasp superfamily ATP-dependent carboligase